MTREQLEEIATDIWRREFGEHSPYTGWVERVAAALRKLDAEAFNSGVEAAANTSESMIVGGRMWTEEQAQAAEVLGAAARNIRALKVEVPR